MFCEKKDREKMRLASHTLEDPAGGVVRGLIDDLDELESSLSAALAEVERLSRVEAALEKWKTKAAKEDTHWTYFILDSASKGLGPAEAGCDVAILSGLGPDGKKVEI